MRRQKPSQKQTRRPTHSAISPPEKNLQQNTETTEQNDEITQTSGNIAPANPLPDYHFGQLPLHAPFLATAPGGIAINQPGDRYEQEAEQIAKEIIHMPTPQREAPLASADETANNSSGQPLQDATRAFMEPRFGYNFGQIRIHADERAGLSAQALEAHAYTTGIDIVFGTGEYNPGTYQGDLLLAHELTHVIQQTAHQPFHESSELAQTSSLSEAGKLPTEMLRGPVIQRQQLDSSTTPTAPPVAGDTTGEQNPPVSSSLPPETLQQLAYAATILRQVQPLPEEQTNRLNQIIADAPVYQMIKRRNEKRAQLEQDRQTLTDYQHRAEAVARGEELAGGVPASQDVIDHLTNEIADLSRETEQLDRDIQANLTRLGVNSEQELLQKIEVAFPEMWINRAKQIANTMLDENRMQVQRELVRYPADASSTDIEGLRSADRHLNTLTIELRDLSQQIETKQSERTEKTRQLQSGQQLNSEVAGGESLPGGVPPSGAELQALQGEVDRLDADIQALRTQIPVKEQALRAQQQAYGAQYPILLLPDYAPGAFVQATPEQLTQMTGSWLQKILDNIGTTRQNINEERLKVWQLRDVPGLTYQSLGVEEHSVFGDGVRAYTQNRQSEEEALHIAEAVFQVGAVVLASVVAGPLGGAIVGGLLTLNQLVEHIDQYNVESAASQVALNPVIADISANEPNLLPIVLDIIALGLDAGAVIGALRPAARILVATGDATQFANDARRVLPAETADQLVSKVTRRVASSASSDVAGTLTQAMRNDTELAHLLDLPGVSGDVSKLTGMNLLQAGTDTNAVLESLRQARRMLDTEAGNLSAQVLQVEGIEDFFKVVVTNPRNLHAAEFELRSLVEQMRRFPTSTFRYQVQIAGRSGPDIVRYEAGGATVVQVKSFGRISDASTDIEDQLVSDLRRLEGEGFMVPGPGGQRVPINRTIEYEINWDRLQSQTLRSDYINHQNVAILEHRLNDYLEALAAQDATFTCAGQPFRVRLTLK